MYLNNFILIILILLGILLLILIFSKIRHLSNDRNYMYLLEKDELNLHKMFLRLFHDNIMHKIGALTNESPYRDCYIATQKTPFQLSDKYDKTVRYTNFQINKNWIEKRTNYSLQSDYLERIWVQVKNNSIVIERFVLLCNFIQIEKRKPMLVLADPFGCVITEPIGGLSLKKANSLVGKLLIVDIEFLEVNSNKVRLHSIETTPFSECGVLDLPRKNRTIYKKLTFKY